jgi:hypothetical protein
MIPSSLGTRTMRTASPVNGSVSDQVNAVVIQLRGFTTLAEVAYRYPRWIRILESAATHAVIVRRRGGALRGAREALDWLDATTREGFWAEAAAEPLRSEVVRCVDRVRRCL